MASSANFGSPGNKYPDYRVDNYSSDLDKLRALGAAAVAAQSKGAKLPASASANPAIGGAGSQQYAVPEGDYLSLAKQMYAPQTQYLDAQEAAAKKRAAENQAALAGIYGQTVKDILGMAPGIKGNFGAGIKGVGNAYGQALGAVGSDFTKSRDEQLAILQRLGIDQAAPNVLDQNSDARALITGILAANNQGSQNALQQMQQAALAFNTEQGNITRQAGAEAQTGARRSLEDVLAKIAGTRADLMSQINQQGISMKNSAQQDAYNRFKDERDFNYQMGKDAASLEMQNRKLQLQYGNKGTTATDPLGKVYALASQVYGNPQSASNAVRLVSEAFGEKQPTNAAQFIQAVLDRAHRANPVVNDESNLQRLAAMMFNELYGKQSPNSLGY